MIPARQLSVLLLSMSLLAPPLSGSPLDAADRFFDKSCDQEKAEEPFLRGMSHYDKECKLAIPLLEEAAGLCPEPEGPLWYRSRGLLKRPYLPFYFLGDCHYILKDLPNALRHFYLSSCAGEPQRDKENTKDLTSLTAGCRQRIKSSQPPYFSEGFTAVQQKNWKEVAEKMWNALQVAEETGEMKLPSGRFPVPYLPRFRLSEALLQLGCHQEACAQLGQSRLKQLDKSRKELGPELQRMKELETLCASKKREPPAQKEMCAQWSCWLQQRGP